MGQTAPKQLESDTPDDDSPEADDAWFRAARPAADVLRELFGDAEAARMTGQAQRTSPVSTDSTGLEGDGTATTVPTHKLTRRP